MQILKPTAHPVLDRRRIKKNGLFPVKISVYYEKGKRLYAVGVDLTEDEWTRVFMPNLRDDSLKQKRRKIELMKEKILSLLDKINPFSFSDFEAFYFGEKKYRSSSQLREIFEEYIETLEKEERIGTAIFYKTTMNSLLSFCGNKKIGELNSDLLRDYEKHLALDSKSPSTIGIYMRQLRRICNY